MNTIEQSGISIQPKEAQAPSPAQLTKLRTAMLTKLDGSLTPEDFDKPWLQKYFSHMNNDHDQMTVVHLNCRMDTIKTGPFSFSLVPQDHVYLTLRQFALNGKYTVGTSRVLPATGEITKQTVLGYNWREISTYFVQKMTGIITNASLATQEHIALFNRHDYHIPIRWIGQR